MITTPFIVPKTIAAVPTIITLSKNRVVRWMTLERGIFHKYNAISIEKDVVDYLIAQSYGDVDVLHVAVTHDVIYTSKVYYYYRNRMTMDSRYSHQYYLSLDSPLIETHTIPSKEDVPTRAHWMSFLQELYNEKASAQRAVKL